MKKCLAVGFALLWTALLLGCALVIEHVFEVAKQSCRIAGGYLMFGVLLGTGALYCYRRSLECWDWVQDEFSQKDDAQ
jgi:small neutral amino acid transporter SnatA (MarC family)